MSAELLVLESILEWKAKPQRKLITCRLLAALVSGVFCGLVGFLQVRSGTWMHQNFCGSRIPCSSATYTDSIEFNKSPEAIIQCCLEQVKTVHFLGAE